MSGDKCSYCDGSGELFGEVGHGTATSFEMSSCPYCSLGFDGEMTLRDRIALDKLMTPEQRAEKSRKERASNEKAVNAAVEAINRACASRDANRR